MANELTRRQAINKAATSAGLFSTGLLSAGLLSPGPVWGLNPRAVGANERVRVALIGCGLRASQLMRSRPDECQVVVTVDADLPKAEKMAAELPGDLSASDNYHAVIEQHELDGVMIATTEPHHVQASMAACDAGLDVYVEKPMSLYFAEGRSLVDLARRRGRVVQVGTQQRSMEMNRFACELVRSGGIGDVRVVETVNYSSPRPMPAGGLPEESVPDGLNWDRWQGCTEDRPFNRRLQSHYLAGLGVWWGDWEAYSIGFLGAFASHSLDMVQYALGMDSTGPVEFWPVGRDETGVMRVEFRYANGVEVRNRFPFRFGPDRRGPGFGGVFVGSECKMEINRNKHTTNPVDFVKDGPPAKLAAKWEGPDSIARGHIQNWLDCIKSRDLPNADVEIGHRSATILHLIHITRRLNRPLRWDPVRETFPDDSEATAMLQRPRRAGWELPTG